VTESDDVVPGSGSGRHLALASQAASSGSFAVAGYDAYSGTVVLVTGELDVATVPVLAHFLRGLITRQGAHLVVDLTGLTFCDCAGLNALLDTHRRAEAAGGWLRLCSVTARTEMLLKITGLSAALRCFATVGDAFADLGRLPAVGADR
jgi:anti-sigma B factor antagonist